MKQGNEKPNITTLSGSDYAFWFMESDTSDGRVNFVREAGSNWLVADVYDVEPDAPNNARLIAAAPALLGVLERLVECVEAGSIAGRLMWADARDAIKQAKGE